MSRRPTAAERLQARPVNVPRVPPPRLAVRWPDEVAASLGVSRSWLYESGIAAEVRFLRRGKVRLVLISELERVVERLSARWDDPPPGPAR